MRIVVTADLHYNVARSKAPTRAIAEEICRLGGDCLLFVGDSASCDLSILEEAFALFDGFKGQRLAVAGNHELWMPIGPHTIGADSLHRYENELRQACVRSGVHYLDDAPYYLGDVAFVGSVGWYDFSFRPSAMKVPLRFFQHKVAPGAASYFEKHQHLLADDADVPPQALEVTCRWMDGVRVRLPMGDIDFTHRQADKLRRHLTEAQNRSRRIIAAVHHLPFAEMVPHSIIPNWEFASGFMGSELLGEVLLEFPTISHVYCGHSHRARRCRKGTLECASIGSTYREKQYEVLEI
jgi:predicted phosphohydrolase